MSHETSVSTSHAKKGGAHFRTRGAHGLGSHQTRRSRSNAGAVPVVPARRGQVALHAHARNRATKMRERDAKLSQDLCEWALVAAAAIAVYGIELLISYLLQVSAGLQ